MFAANLCEDFLKRRQSLRVNEFQQSQFEVQARIGFASQLVVGHQQNIEKARKVFFAEERRVLRQPGAFVCRRSDELRIRPANTGHQQIAEVADRFPAKVLKILSISDESVDQPKRTTPS